MKEVHEIRSVRKGSFKLSDEDRLALCTLLIKAGYAARIKRRIGTGGKTSEYTVEYWEEGET